MNASIEHVLKRLKDCLRVQSAILEQSEELGWILKDVLADLVLALHEDSLPKEATEGEASQAPGLASRGNP